MKVLNLMGDSSAQEAQTTGGGELLETHEDQVSGLGQAVKFAWKAIPTIKECRRYEHKTRKAVGMDCRPNRGQSGYISVDSEAPHRQSPGWVGV